MPRCPCPVYLNDEDTMADSVEVHFKLADTTPVRAVFTPGGRVKAALILPDGPEEGAGLTKKSFVKANKLKFNPKKAIPPEVKVKHKDETNTENVTIDLTKEGPGVCYWVDDTLVCW